MNPNIIAPKILELPIKDLLVHAIIGHCEGEVIAEVTLYHNSKKWIVEDNQSDLHFDWKVISWSYLH